MKTFTQKPTTMMAEQWNGGKDEKLVEDLVQAGWNVYFQQPDVETIETYDADKGEYVNIPTPARMVIVGPYRGQITQVEAGHWLVYHQDHDRFNSWHGKPDADGWDEQVDEFRPPTPFTMNSDKQTGELLEF